MNRAKAQSPNGAGQIACRDCPLQTCPGLRPLTAAQLAFMQGFKQGEIALDAGTQLLVQGTVSAHLYTVLDGVLIRTRLLADGRRQILNFMFPGDLIGLQGAMDDPLEHGVETLTRSRLCLLPRDRLMDLFRDQPRLGFDVSWLSAQEEASLEGHLVSLGQRKAKERIASLAAFLMRRGQQTGRVRGKVLAISLTQTQLAETVGLSMVHTNRSLQALRRAGLLRWTTDQLEVPDLAALEAFAAVEPPGVAARPFL